MAPLAPPSYAYGTTTYSLNCVYSLKRTFVRIASTHLASLYAVHFFFNKRLQL